MTKLLLSSMSGELFLNMGRSMLTLVLGLYLYQNTGTLWAFALTFFSEFLVAITVQGISGKVVDEFGHQLVLPVALLSSALSVFSCTALLQFENYQTTVMIICILLLNMIRPFIRTSVFTLVADSFKPNKLEQVNGGMSFSRQSGLVLGKILAAIILTQSSPIIAFGAIGLCFTLGTIGFGITSLVIRNSVSQKDETEVISPTPIKYLSLVKHPYLLKLTLIGAIDFGLMALFNLLLAPAVTHNRLDPALWMPLIDGSFALGALTAGIYLLNRKKVFSKPSHYTLGSISSIFLLSLVYATKAAPLLMLICSLFFGYFCCISIVAWGSRLQRSVHRSIRGRAASIRYVANTLCVALTVSIISGSNGFSFKTAAYATTGLSILLAIGCILLNRWQTKTVYIEHTASPTTLEADRSQTA